MDMCHFKRIFNTLAWLSILLVFHFASTSYGQDAYNVLWLIDNTNSIDSNATTKLGDPIVIETELGSAVEFDGVNDGLIVDSNPLADAEQFTVEVIFNPYQALLSVNEEQRFIHIQESDDRRILIELRLTENSEWFLDTFIKDGNSNCVLYASEFPHAINKWYHAALVYKDGVMSHYVNGIFELSGNVQYSKMTSGQTSIGVRLNQVSWFKGAIRSLRITHEALDSEAFMINLTDINQGYLDRNNTKKNVELELYQNYPNPFNPETIIHYDLPDSEYVELTIFDILGKKVSILINEYKQAGSHQVTWNAKNNLSKLAAGIYFAQLKTASITKSIRLLYLP